MRPGFESQFHLLNRFPPPIDSLSALDSFILLSSTAFLCHCKILSPAMNSIRLSSPNSNPNFFPNSSPMNLLAQPPVRRHRSYRATIPQLIPTVSHNLAVDFEAVADEPRGDVIRRHLSIRVHGGGGIGGAGGGENFCGGLCVICHNEFADGERVGVLDCGHEYHETCIHSWLMRRNVCPLCQRTAIRGLRST